MFRLQSINHALNPALQGRIVGHTPLRGKSFQALGALAFIENQAVGPVHEFASKLIVLVYRTLKRN